MDESRISLLFAADEGYAQHTAVAMMSALLRTARPECVTTYIIDGGLSADARRKIAATAESRRSRAVFLTPPATAEDFYVSAHLSRAAYLRLAMAELLPPQVERVIYLDGDLLVRDDIGKLWTSGLGGRPLGAVPDFGIMASARTRREKAAVLGLGPREPYFNSGVLLADLAQWRGEDLGGRARALAAEHHYPHHDQDALNALFRGRWQALPLRWNVIPPVWQLFSKVLRQSELRRAALDARRDIAILHYAGGAKPWEYPLTSGFNDVYYRVLGETAYRDAPMPQPRPEKRHPLWRQRARLWLANGWQHLLS